MENQYIGDICKVKRGIICYLSNSQRMIGNGLDHQLLDKYPKHYLDFLSIEPELGKIAITEINSEFYIVTLCAQYTFGPKRKLCIHYGAFEQGLHALNAFSMVKDLPVFLSYDMGGRDWNKLHSIIEENLQKYVIVYSQLCRLQNF